MNCKCGNHWFSCTKVVEYDVEISTQSDAELEQGEANVTYKGPFICTECGQEYESIND